MSEGLLAKRWGRVMVNGVHVSQVDFNALTDTELLELFERVIQRFYTQM